jgi:hypothetical protein
VVSIALRFDLGREAERTFVQCKGDDLGNLGRLGCTILHLHIHSFRIRIGHLDSWDVGIPVNDRLKTT